VKTYKELLDFCCSPVLFFRTAILIISAKMFIVFNKFYLISDEIRMSNNENLWLGILAKIIFYAAIFLSIKPILKTKANCIVGGLAAAVISLIIMLSHFLIIETPGIYAYRFGSVPLDEILASLFTKAFDFHYPIILPSLFFGFAILSAFNFSYQLPSIIMCLGIFWFEFFFFYPLKSSLLIIALSSMIILRTFSLISFSPNTPTLAAVFFLILYHFIFNSVDYYASLTLIVINIVIRLFFEFARPDSNKPANEVVSIMLSLAFFSLLSYQTIGGYLQKLIFTLSIPGVFFQEILFIFLLNFIFSRFKSLSRLTFSSISLVAFTIIFALLSLVDCKVYSITGTRFTYQTLLFAGNIDIAWASISEYSLYIFFGFAIVVAAVLLDYRATIKVPFVLTKQHFSILLVFFVSALLPSFSGVDISHRSDSAPFRFFKSKMQRYSFQSQKVPANLLEQLSDLSPFPEQVKENSEPKYKNVILIFAESLHVRYLSLYGYHEDTTPRLSSYKPNMRLFTRMHCNFPGSEHAHSNVMYGIYSENELLWNVNPRLIKTFPNLLSILKEHNYRTSFFCSHNAEYRNLAQLYVSNNVDEIFDKSNLPDKEKFKKFNWGVDEECAKQAIIKQIHMHNEKNERFLIVYHPNHPHHPFDHLSSSDVIFRPTSEELGKINFYPSKYKNSVRKMDSVYGDILDEIKKLNMLDSTLFVLVGDHGEMLGENGFIGHGFHTEPPLTNIAFFIIEPERTKFLQDDTLCSHIDVMPTILDLLDIPLPEGFLYQGSSVFHKHHNSFFIFSSLEKAWVTNSNFFRLTDSNAVFSYPVADSFGIGLASDFQQEYKMLTDPEKSAMTQKINDFYNLQKMFLRHYDNGLHWQSSGQ